MQSLNLAKPHLIVVVGVPGAGKTFFAKQFSDAFSLPFLLLDDLSDFTRSQEATTRLADFTLGMLIRTQHTIVIEGSGSTVAERQQLTTFARLHGYMPLFIWVQTEPSTAQVRAVKGVRGQAPKHPLTNRQFEELAAAFEPLTSREPCIVISGKHTYPSQAKNVLTKLTALQLKLKQIKVTKTRRPRTTTAKTPSRGRVKVK